MARRRLTPAQPGYLAPDSPAPETKSAPFASAPPIAKISGQSAEAAALRELAEGIETARTEGRMIVEVPLGDISAGFLVRDRLRLDREELDALKVSIRNHGQRTPAEIAPLDQVAGGNNDGNNNDGVSPYRFGLISGWRRLRALAELFDETGEARFSTLRALIRQSGEAAESYVSMVEENEIRVGLSYYERARVVAETTARGVFADQGEALRTLFATASRAKRSKIGSFVILHETLSEVLNFPTEIHERLGLALVARLRQPGGEAAIRAALAEARPASAEAELRLLEGLAVGGRKPTRRKPESERLTPDLILTSKLGRERLELVVSGPGVDQKLLEDLRAMLRKR